MQVTTGNNDLEGKLGKPLSKRELEAVVAAARWDYNDTSIRERVAEVLHINPYSAKNYLQGAREGLGVNDIFSAIITLLKQGMISVADLTGGRDFKPLLGVLSPEEKNALAAMYKCAEEHGAADHNTVGSELVKSPYTINGQINSVYKKASEFKPSFLVSNKPQLAVLTYVLRQAL